MSCYRETFDLLPEWHMQCNVLFTDPKKAKGLYRQGEDEV